MLKCKSNPEANGTIVFSGNIRVTPIYYIKIHLLKFITQAQIYLSSFRQPESYSKIRCYQ